MKNEDRHPLNIGAMGKIIVRPCDFDRQATEWTWMNRTGVPLRVTLVAPGEIHLEPCGPQVPAGLSESESSVIVATEDA